MNIKRMRDNWNKWGETDPLFAILTDPQKQGGKWKLEEFFETGAREINDVMSYVEGLSIPLERQRALDFGCGVGRLTQGSGALLQRSLRRGRRPLDDRVGTEIQQLRRPVSVFCEC